MSIPTQVRRVANLLKKRGLKVVFAESCTGGLVAGALTRVPGISEYHCGGMVVYRNATKQAYLGISKKLLENPGPVSAEVAIEMATRVLDLTREADVAAAVTGHLGPGAPPEFDGVIFFAIALRTAPLPKRRMKTGRQKYQTLVQKHDCQSSESRLPRQREAAERVLAGLADFLEKH